MTNSSHIINDFLKSKYFTECKYRIRKWCSITKEDVQYLTTKTIDYLYNLPKEKLEHIENISVFFLKKMRQFWLKMNQEKASHSLLGSFAELYYLDSILKQLKTESYYLTHLHLPFLKNGLLQFQSYSDDYFNVEHGLYKSSFL